MDYLNYAFNNLYIFGFLAIAVPVIISLRMYVIIIYSVRYKNLMDDPVDRSSHDRKTPTLGGVGIFITFSIFILFWSMIAPLVRQELIGLLSVLVACIILLFLGVKDDLIGFSPIKKMIVQLFSACVLVYITDFHLISFEGLFGIYELPTVFSELFTVFIFIFIINAFNLIDGIDGLAGSIGLISCITFGVFFCGNKDNLLLMISLTLIGSILGFLRFNMSKKYRIFMGDSGSMFIGFLMSYLAISFLNLNVQDGRELGISNGLIFALAVLSYPILDTLRVFTIRISQKRSPFSADQNHIHHGLLRLGLDHKQASFWIVITNCFIVAISVSIYKLNLNLQLGLMLIIIPLLYLLPFTFETKFDKIRAVNDDRENL